MKGKYLQYCISAQWTQKAVILKYNTLLKNEQPIMNK